MLFQGIFGTVQNPLTTLGSGYGNLENFGLINFLSNIIRAVIVFAGVYVLFNLIIAGLDYITSEGDPKGAESARAKIRNSVIGLAIIAGAFAGTAIMGQIFFGSYTAILSPKIFGPGDTP